MQGLLYIQEDYFKVKRLLITLMAAVMLGFIFMPLSAAEEELSEFDLGQLNRLSELAWQDVASSQQNAGEEGSTFNGLTIDIFLASKTLIIELENEPADEFEIIIVGNSDGDRAGGSVIYKKADVFEDGFITIDLESNPGWQILKNNGQAGFRIILSGRGWRDVGDIFGMLEYLPSELSSFNLWKSNMVADASENLIGFSDQVRADWEEEDKIGLTTDILARATSINFEVFNAPVGDIGIALMNNENNWDATVTQVTYSPDDIFSGNLISIPLAGANSPSFMADFREKMQSNFTLAIIYNGSNTDPQTFEYIGVEKIWLGFTEVEPEPEPDPDPTPDPDTTPAPNDTTPGSDPSDTPDRPAAIGPTLVLSNNISPWATVFMIAVAVIAVAVSILAVLMKNKSKR